ncbi:DUF1707 domain-containing protein [Streptomyces sp. NPDC004111]|uniref:DUF1707 SHOCT-like domain-containing protein n=1 Tax=Streptomyces sp. NPDC004111 TaxID=3364690 RepID=UPI00369045F9
MTAEPAGHTGPAEAPARRPLRASDADRDAVVEQLRDAAADGRIDLAELDERLELALGAKTVAELGPLVEDLVPEGHEVRLPGAPTGEPLVLKGGMHGAVREGRWQVPARIVAHGGMAGVRLDFTRAEVRGREVEVEAYGEMAGVVLVLPEGWAVNTDAMEPGIGGVKNRLKGERTPGTPLIRMSGTGGMAGVVIRHPGPMLRRKLRREAEDK